MQRTTDEKAFQIWLAALQASIVLRRQGSTLRKTKTGSSGTTEKVSPPVSIRHQRAKSTINDQRLTFDEKESSEKKNGNPFSRISLSFIPGHGKKYSTYDGSRSICVEQSANEVWAKSSDDNKLAGTPKLRKKPLKEPRPLSESVSDFLMLNSQSSENLTETKDEPVEALEVEAGTTETKDEPAKKVEVEAGTIDKKKISSHLKETKDEPAKKVDVEAGTTDRKKSSPHLPKLPTSFGVGKLLSNLQSTTGGTGSKSRRHSKSMTSLLDVPVVVDPKQQKSSSQAEIIVEDKPALFAKSEEILSKRASDTTSVNRKSAVEEESQTIAISDTTDCPPESKETDAKIASPPQEASVCADGGGRDSEISDDKKKDKKKIKDSTRRKSGLAMIRQFFLSAKIGIRRKGEAADKDKLSVNDIHIRKTSNGSGVPSEKNSARTSLTVETDTQQESQCEQMSEQKQPTQVPGESQVLEIPSIVILQRLDSQISEGVESVQEEAFVAANAYKYEAKIIEIVEPEPYFSVPSDSVALPSNPKEINRISPQLSDNDFTDSSAKSARNSAKSTASLENSILNEKPRKISDVMTKEDKEVAELRPSLPMKTKVKCPSPGYDIPRTSPIAIPCPEQVGKNHYDSAELPCFDLKDAIAAAETESSIKESSNCSSELTQNPLPADSTKSETGSNTISRVSHLIKTFSNDAISYTPAPSNRLSIRNSQRNSGIVERRISFAQAETVVVQEEIVQTLASDSFEK